MRLTWLTDIHLDFVSLDRRQKLVRDIIATNADAVIIGGDIAVAETFAEDLLSLHQLVACPVYFVLGNHDYFGGSIESVRQQARNITLETDLQVGWLPALGVVRLGTADSLCNTALIGHGGWGDGRCGTFFESDLVLHDYLRITELNDAFTSEGAYAGALPSALFERLNNLGDDVVSSLSESLPDALNQADNVILLMHVPPFREACWYQGRISDDNWAPHFVCQAAGEYLRSVMQENPDKKLTVLCGHTHGAGTADILPNLRVITGAADYGKPAVQQILDVS